MDSLRAEGRAARDVVPQLTETKSFRLRRRSDEARVVSTAPVAPEPVYDVPVAPPVAPPVVRAPVAPPAPAPVALEALAAPAVDGAGTQADELSRAQTTLLRAALRQNEELSSALREEQDLRRQEHERLTAENQLLRDALAALHAEALERQETVVVASTADTAPRVPEQRADAPPGGRRRSAREAGPA